MTTQKKVINTETLNDKATETLLIADALANKDRKDERSKLGEKALSLLSDYPTYMATSNITYGEAIAMAAVIFGDIEKAYAQRVAK